MAHQSATAEAPNIALHKQQFLLKQVSNLSTPLQMPLDTDIDLPSKTLDLVLTALNTKLRTHNRSVFSVPAQRHIAEQIETLFWNEVLEERDALQGEDGNAAATVVRRDLNLCSASSGTAGSQNAIEKELPEHWTDVVVPSLTDPEEEPDNEDEATSEEAAQYAALRSQLLDLTAQRNAAAQKVTQYRQLQILLQPFEKPQEIIQPNLVTKDGELSKEMERMRSLLVRVRARMGEHHNRPPESSDGEEGEPVAVRGFGEQLDTLMSEA